MLPGCYSASKGRLETDLVISLLPVLPPLMSHAQDDGDVVLTRKRAREFHEFSRRSLKDPLSFLRHVYRERDWSVWQPSNEAVYDLWQNSMISIEDDRVCCVAEPLEEFIKPKPGARQSPLEDKPVPRAARERDGCRQCRRARYDFHGIAGLLYGTDQKVARVVNDGKSVVG